MKPGRNRVVLKCEIALQRQLLELVLIVVLEYVKARKGQVLKAKDRKIALDRGLMNVRDDLRNEAIEISKLADRIQ